MSTRTRILLLALALAIFAGCYRARYPGCAPGGDPCCPTYATPGGAPTLAPIPNGAPPPTGLPAPPYSSGRVDDGFRAGGAGAGRMEDPPPSGPGAGDVNSPGGYRPDGP